MENKIKAAFGSVYASEELKSKTQAFIAQKSLNYTTRRSANYQRIFSAAAVTVCAAAVVFAGIKLYFTPTTHINIDINPSLDLGINLFDRVVSVNALNNDGEKLIMEIPDIKFTAYDEALRRILGSESIEAMLSEDEIMTVTVIETNTPQSANILSAAKACASGYSNVHCHSANSEDASAASELGLSYEKYLAYLELRAIDPNITSEVIRNMTMREIRDLTAQLTGNDLNSNGGDHYDDDGHDDDHDNNDEHENSSSTVPETGHHGNGHGHGYGHE